MLTPYLHNIQSIVKTKLFQTISVCLRNIEGISSNMLLLPSTIKVLVLSIMEINMCLRHWFISCLIRNWISLGILTIWCIGKKYTSFRVNNTWNTLAETRVTLFRCSSYLLICRLILLSLLGCILALGLVLICYNTSRKVVASCYYLTTKLSCTRQSITEFS